MAREDDWAMTGSPSRPAAGGTLTTRLHVAAARIRLALALAICSF